MSCAVPMAFADDPPWISLVTAGLSCAVTSPGHERLSLPSSASEVPTPVDAALRSTTLDFSTCAGCFGSYLRVCILRQGGGSAHVVNTMSPQNSS